MVEHCCPVSNRIKNLTAKQINVSLWTHEVCTKLSIIAHPHSVIFVCRERCLFLTNEVIRGFYIYTTSSYKGKIINYKTAKGFGFTFLNLRENYIKYLESAHLKKKMSKRLKKCVLSAETSTCFSPLVMNSLCRLILQKAHSSLTLFYFWMWGWAPLYSSWEQSHSVISDHHVSAAESIYSMALMCSSVLTL